MVASKADNIISADEEFEGEDGMMKPFWKCQKSECMFAQGIGYHCFGCNTAFYVDVCCIDSNLYEFYDEEIIDLDDQGLQYMPDIDWTEICPRLVFVSW